MPSRLEPSVDAFCEGGRGKGNNAVRISVKVKLASAFGLVILVSGIAGALAIDGLAEMNATIGKMTSTSVVGLTSALRASIAVGEVVRQEKDMLLSDSLTGHSEFHKSMVAARDNVRGHIAELRTVVDIDGKAKADAALAAFERLAAVHDKEWDLAKLMSNSAAFELSKAEGVPAAKAIVAEIEPLIARAANATGTPEQMRVAIQAQQALNQLRSAQVAIRDSFLTSDDDETKLFVDQTREHAAASKHILDTLRASGADAPALDAAINRFTVWEGVAERMIALSLINGDGKAVALSNGEGRAAAVQTRALMDEVVAAKQHDMDAAQAAAAQEYDRLRNTVVAAIATALVIALASAAVLARAIGSGLGKASALANAVAIGDLGQTISVSSDDEIKDLVEALNRMTTNLRATSAVAGEHGKGFAVVASEVRKLAERSQTAASEISGLSSDTVGVADQASRMLGKLVPDIRKTAALVEAISAACREQDVGAEQVNHAIQQLDAVTQQNSAASEQMSATSEELAAQAEALKRTIDYFHIGRETKVPGRVMALVR